MPTASSWKHVPRWEAERGKVADEYCETWNSHKAKQQNFSRRFRWQGILMDRKHMRWDRKLSFYVPWGLSIVWLPTEASTSKDNSKLFLSTRALRVEKRRKKTEPSLRDISQSQAQGSCAFLCGWEMLRNANAVEEGRRREPSGRREKRAGWKKAVNHCCLGQALIRNTHLCLFHDPMNQEGEIKCAGHWQLQALAISWLQ